MQSTFVQSDDPDLLWQPSLSDIAESPTFHFLSHVNAKYSPNPPLQSYDDLYHWSVDPRTLAAFWSEVWDNVGIIGQKGTHVVGKSDDGVCEDVPALNPLWFEEARVNWAENMLRLARRDEGKHRTALIQVNEPMYNDTGATIRRVTYDELYVMVADIVSALLEIGLQPGDRVASYSSNCIENVAACLAASAIGCIWVSAAADFGPEGVLERFEQVQPKVVFSVAGEVYKGKFHNHIPKLLALLVGMRKCGCEPTHVVVIGHQSFSNETNGLLIDWEDFRRVGKSKRGVSADGEILWKRMPFNWPLWILFSSGTTGKPKPIVHRAGGMLIQARKEFAICADIKPSDVFFYYTTTGWMMWNFLVAGLASGCSLVLYDGSPLHDPSFLWKLVEDLGITIFGTSAKYLDQLSKVYKPRELHDLSTLRHIYSTGSPLPAALFDYVYNHIRKDVLLASITGGTDICSLFAGMCTALPVYRGEIQCRMLGMAIETVTPTSGICVPGEAGDLVCLRPFPCMPAGFWPLPGFGSESKVKAAQDRYCSAYFSTVENMWYHGDHVVIARSRGGNGGGLIMLGRSDGVLNPSGVRFGSSELYEVLESCFKPGLTAAQEHVIVDCLAVGHSISNDTDERVILFIKLDEGFTSSNELETRIRTEIRNRRSARHVPARIIQVQDIPYTLNGKRVEVPVKKIINGSPITSVNAATLRNPESLLEYERIGAMLCEETKYVG